MLLSQQLQEYKSFQRGETADSESKTATFSDRYTPKSAITTGQYSEYETFDRNLAQEDLFASVCML